MPKKDARNQGAGGTQAEQKSEASVVRPAGTTGRYLVLFKKGAEKAGVQALSKRAGIAMASSADYDTSPSSAVAEMASDGGLFFETLGVAVVDTPPQTIQSLSLEMTDDNPILAVEA